MPRSIVMVIDCIRCDTECHLNEEMLREAIEKGIQVRCSCCGFSRKVRIFLPSFQGDGAADEVNLQIAQYLSG